MDADRGCRRGPFAGCDGWLPGSVRVGGRAGLARLGYAVVEGATAGPHLEAGQGSRASSSLENLEAREGVGQKPPVMLVISDQTGGEFGGAPCLPGFYPAIWRRFGPSVVGGALSWAVSCRIASWRAVQDGRVAGRCTCNLSHGGRPHN